MKLDTPEVLLVQACSTPIAIKLLSNMAWQILPSAQSLDILCDGEPRGNELSAITGPTFHRSGMQMYHWKVAREALVELWIRTCNISCLELLPSRMKIGIATGKIDIKSRGRVEVVTA